MDLIAYSIFVSALTLGRVLYDCHHPPKSAYGTPFFFLLISHVLTATLASAPFVIAVLLWRSYPG